MLILAKRGGIWDPNPIVATNQPAVGLCAEGGNPVEELLVILANSDVTGQQFIREASQPPAVYSSKLACRRWEGAITVETPPGEIYERVDVDGCTYSGSEADIVWPVDPESNTYTGAENSMITTSFMPAIRRTSVSVSWPSDFSDLGIEVNYTVSCPDGTQTFTKTIGHLWADFEGEISQDGQSLVGSVEPVDNFYGDRRHRAINTWDQAAQIAA